eukprot:Amastigsp_a181283_5.p4 type:complete len:123 gc:universal Amastigsp_a181283_5:67-435(+)
MCRYRLRWGLALWSRPLPRRSCFSFSRVSRATRRLCGSRSVAWVLSALPLSPWPGGSTLLSLSDRLRSPICMRSSEWASGRPTRSSRRPQSAPTRMSACLRSPMATATLRLPASSRAPLRWG